MKTWERKRTWGKAGRRLYVCAPRPSHTEPRLEQTVDIVPPVMLARSVLYLIHLACFQAHVGKTLIVQQSYRERAHVVLSVTV